MRIRLSDIGAFLRNSFFAVLKGEFLLRLNAGKYFMHIIYTFALFCLIILVSLMTETTMAKVEENKRIIKELEIANSQRVYELAYYSRRSEVILNLEKLRSPVAPASKPATVLSPDSKKSTYKSRIEQ